MELTVPVIVPVKIASIENLTTKGISTGPNHTNKPTPTSNPESNKSEPEQTKATSPNPTHTNRPEPNQSEPKQT